MIDFTKIQTVPVPPTIVNLQSKNGILSKENKKMRIVISLAAVTAIGFIAYYYFKKYKENETNKENQSARD